MRGEKVMVRVHDGSWKACVVWEEKGDRVFVTSEDNYRKLLGGEQDALPIGFPKSDVKPLKNQSVDK